jgi:CRP/FNR family cyclic AMP-dependent transcriptional regulator
MPESLSKPTLPTFSWIGHLKEDDRELLSSYGEFFPGHPGSVILQQGNLQTEVVVVISGELEVHGERPDGTRIFRARVGPGETLGEISLFDPGPATATVTASEFSQLWRIADEDLIQFMDQNRGAGLVLLRTLATILAQRLRRVDPEAFGLSAYAVVDSPELEEKPELDTPAEDEPVALAVAVPEIVVPPKPAPKKGDAVPDPSAPAVSAPPLRPSETVAPENKLNKKTQPIVDPDEEELEPL